MIIPLVAAVIFAIVALSNAQCLYTQLRTEKNPSFILVVGPIAGCVFLINNPWNLAGWKWCLLFLDMGLLPLLLGMILQIKVVKILWNRLSKDSIDDNETSNNIFQEKNESCKQATKEYSKNFSCPDCNSKALVIVKSIELGSDSRNDEYSLQAIKCRACNMVGVSSYQESRRGAEDSWEHFGYKMESAVHQAFLKQLSQCNAPTKAKCSCDAHVLFGSKNKYGTLTPLENLKYEKRHFQMKL